MLAGEDEGVSGVGQADDALGVVAVVVEAVGTFSVALCRIKIIPFRRDLSEPKWCPAAWQTSLDAFLR